MNTDFWSWNGSYVGYKNGNNLFSKNGSPIGYFVNDLLFDFSGHYLADVKEKNRLIVVINHKFKISNAYIKPINSISRSCVNKIGKVMLSGCENFILVV